MSDAGTSTCTCGRSKPAQIPARPRQHGPCGTVLVRQAQWTRLGIRMGYTDTEPKRQQIRNAAQQLTWGDPAQLTDELDEPHVRQVAACVLFGSAESLAEAGVVEMPPGPVGQRRRLIGLRTRTDEWWLLRDDYEAVSLRHAITHADRPADATRGGAQ
jgi:hypothetical protein